MGRYVCAYTQLKVEAQTADVSRACVWPFSLLSSALPRPATAQAAEGDIIVIREPGADAREVRQDAEVRLVKPLSIERAELVEPRDGDVASALAELRADDDVLAADVDSVVIRRRRPLRTPPPVDVGLGPAQHLRRRRPGTLSEGAGVTVGVVDTGVQADHEDLAGQVIGGYDFISRDSVAQDGNGHGTHVAGTIAALANNNKGILGVAPSAKVVPLRALDDGGSGYMSDVAAAFDYAGDQGLRIVNASLAGGYAGVLETVIAAHPNTLYVVAAGNDSQGQRPACPGELPVRAAAAEHHLRRGQRQPRQHRLRSPTTARPPSTSARRA